MDDKYIASLINKIEAKESEDSIEHKFDPRQPRDKTGKWTAGVGAFFQKKREERQQREDYEVMKKYDEARGKAESEKKQTEAYDKIATKAREGTIDEATSKFTSEQQKARNAFYTEQSAKAVEFDRKQDAELTAVRDSVSAKQQDIRQKYLDQYGDKFEDDPKTFKKYWKEVSEVQKETDDLIKKQKIESEEFHKKDAEDLAKFHASQDSDRKAFDDVISERTKEREEAAKTEAEREQRKAESDAEYEKLKEKDEFLGNQAKEMEELTKKQAEESENLSNEIAVQKKDLEREYKEEYGEDFATNPDAYKSYTKELADIDVKQDKLESERETQTKQLTDRQEVEARLFDEPDRKAEADAEYEEMRKYDNQLFEKKYQEESERTMEEIQREAAKKEKKELREAEQREREREREAEKTRKKEEAESKAREREAEKEEMRRAAEETRRQEAAEQRRQQQETAKQKAAEEAAKKYEEDLKTMQATSQTLSAGKKFVSNLGGTVDLVMPRKTAKPLDLRGIESKELQDRINRYNLEQNYNSIFNIRQKELDAGRAKVTKGFNVAASIIGTAASAAALMIAIKQLRGK